MTLILIGYWQSEARPEWPDPRNFVDPEWDEGEKDLTSSYLKSGTEARMYMGFSTCRFCGQRNGAKELSDGIFIWPEGLAHYIDTHGVRPPDKFVRHAVERTEYLELAPVDRDWWQQQTAP